MTPPAPPRPKQPSRPDLSHLANPVDAVVGSARVQSRTELPRAEQVQRAQTLTGLAPVEPGRQLPPPLPPTKRPPLPWGKTVRAPSPAPLIAQSRRSDPPPRQDARPRPLAGADDSEPDTAVESPQAARSEREALQTELLDTKRRLAEAERLAAVLRETASPASHWPPEAKTGRHQTPVPSSGPAPKPGDWQKLGFKVATAVVAALVLVIAALGYWAVTAINAKTEAIKAAQEAKVRADNRDLQWKQWASVVTWIQDCRNGQQIDVNEMLLPAPDKMGSARKPEPWIVKCPKALPPPP